MLTLRELDPSELEDEAHLRRFEQCRCEVMRVSSSRLLPECIALTTKGGFVQLVNVSTGAFRVFLTHLGNMPLESQLRCFSLAPSLYATKGAHSLLYSLAYSNELLLADMEQGTVSVLATFQSRPSVVYCDGDYIVCGEGSGQVTLWRSPSATDGDATIEWRRSVFTDTVVCITLQRAYVVCSSVDQHSYVLSLRGGDIIAKLAQGPEAAVSLQSVTTSQLSGGFMLLCLPTVLTVYAPPNKEVAAPPCPTDGTVWDCSNSVQLDTQINCLSCCVGLIACGTASGVVILMTMDETGREVVERVRFNVGFAVVCVQLFDDDTLVVVTSSGDVWKWTTTDLLPEEPACDLSGEEELPEPNVQPPTATSAAPRPTHESMGLDNPQIVQVTSSEVVNPGYLNECGKEEEEEITIMMDDESHPLPSRVSTLPSRHPVNLRTHCREGSDNKNVGDYQEIFDTPNEVLAHMAECSGDRSDHMPTCARTRSPSGTVTESETFSDDGNSCSSRSSSPSSVSVAGYATADVAADRITNGAIQSSPPSEQNLRSISRDAAGDFAVDVDATLTSSPGTCACPPVLEAGLTTADAVAVAACNEVTERGGEVCSPTRYTLTHTLDKVLRAVDVVPPLTIKGLCAGRRMDPRKAKLIAETDCHEEPAPGPEKQSSQMLMDYREGLEDTPFDYAAYAGAHPLKTEALKYRYPVRMPVYSTRAQLFTPSTELRVTNIKGNSEENNMEVNRKKESRQDHNDQQENVTNFTIADDLMNATYGRLTRRKDPLLEEERQLGGPDIRRHSCGGLLCGTVDPNGTVLFQEFRVQPSPPGLLLLPMPLPPTPTVF